MRNYIYVGNRSAGQLVEVEWRGKRSNKRYSSSPAIEIQCKDEKQMCCILAVYGYEW